MENETKEKNDYEWEAKVGDNTYWKDEELDNAFDNSKYLSKEQSKFSVSITVSDQYLIKGKAKSVLYVQFALELIQEKL